jgi:membrane protein
MNTSWKLRGLTLPELIRRTVRASWKDEVFGQAGRMAFYHFIAIFPILFVILALLARAPHMRDFMLGAINDLSNQALPERVAQLVQSVIGELNERTASNFRLIFICGGAVWGAFNATWAMIYGLNNAYEVEEDRSSRTLAFTIAGLSASLAATASLSVLLIFCTRYIHRRLDIGVVPLHVIEWFVMIATLSFSFAILYRFAPNLPDREWQWSTPGALCAIVVWIGATFGARFYFNHVNNYARSYGHLNGVVMLLLWLYISNAAILIGGEMNSEIEKAANQHQPESQKIPSRLVERRPKQNPLRKA